MTLFNQKGISFSKEEYYKNTLAMMVKVSNNPLLNQQYIDTFRENQSNSIDFLEYLIKSIRSKVSGVKLDPLELLKLYQKEALNSGLCSKKIKYFEINPKIPLPNAYIKDPRIKELCKKYRVPLLFGNDTEVLCLASTNPFSLNLVHSELNRLLHSEKIIPYVSLFLIEGVTYKELTNRHFKNN